MNLPLLDCHAHISPAVTDRQLEELGTAIVFAMTREPAEAAEATRRNDQNILWGYGAHPSFVARGGAFDAGTFARSVVAFSLVGEVGLDRRSGELERQRQVFRHILRISQNQPVLMSVHSVGCIDETLDCISEFEAPGLILHWFSGTQNQVERALELGCYFSVNSMMREHVLDLVPLDRMLPETDYPTGNQRGGTKPGDSAFIERTVARRLDLAIEEVRRQWYRNLRRIALDSGAINRLPGALADTLILQGP